MLFLQSDSHGEPEGHMPLPLEQALGQQFLLSFSGKKKPSPEMLAAIARQHIGGIVLFRAGEGQVTTIGPLFLKDSVENGGLGLSTDQIGAVYGTVASLAFIGGSILGGYFTSWLGLRRAMFFLILAMNLPNLAYFFLSAARPTSTPLIATALSIEMFGYGFGFVGLILFMMQEVAPGRYQTAHYSLATGFMQLGYVLFKMVSGNVQAAMGYKTFFIWVLISAIPALVLSRVIPWKEASASPATPDAAPAQA